MLQQPVPREPYCLDHFETFERTQDLPFGVATLGGARSGLGYGLEPAPHRRTGRMSPAHKRRARNRRPTPRPRGYAGPLRRCLDRMPARRDGPEHPPVLATDDKPASRAVPARHPGRRLVRHRACPDPPRGAKGEPRRPRARERDAARFPCDRLHALLRHCQAHHHRETIAFGRRLNAVCERRFVSAVRRNFIERGSGRDPKSPTPAMAAGPADERWTWERSPARRILAREVTLPPTWRRLYERRGPTPEPAADTVHARVCADWASGEPPPSLRSRPPGEGREGPASAGPSCVWGRGRRAPG